MNIPLAEKLRPKILDEIVGQNHLLSKKSLIHRLVQQQRPVSILLWGPPGCGKTTLARAYAHAFNARFYQLSAVSSGVQDVKKIIEDIQSQPLLHGNTHLFIDEIHRYNKAQQDLFLPYLERGLFILIGATTENPSFSINNALLSRVRVLTLKALDREALELILLRYESQFGSLPLNADGRAYLIEIAQGDGRYILNLIENLQGIERADPFTVEELQAVLQTRAALFDKSGEGHYNIISALHKSVRGSDPQAALYWFARMLEGGEDPLFIARRVIRMASEDIGLADPMALQQAIAARDAYEMLGSPEGELAIAQAIVYMALAPKSNALYVAYNQVQESVVQTTHLDPPKIILNAPTKLMKEIGYGKGYIYDHDTPEGFSGQNYFPDGMEPETYYHPVERGFEREMQKRLAYFQALRTHKREQ